MRLIVGLGNPGRSYTWSKHNIGFLVLDQYAKTHKWTFVKETKFQGEYYKTDTCVFLKPKTFMNLSGISVQAVAHFFKIEAQDILVISDDLDLPLFKLRLREKGSAGGHNGLKSIIQSLSSNTFNRLRIGIDRKEEMESKDYVLSPFSKQEKKQLEDLYAQTNLILDLFASGVSFDTIMNQFNRN